MNSELDITTPWLQMDIPWKRSDPKLLWMLSEGEVSSSDSLRMNGAGDSSGLPRGRHHLDLAPHWVPCVPKLSKNLHDAITVDYSKEFRSKCWQGNETGIAVLVSGEVKPEGWTSRAWKGRESAIGTDTILRHRRELESSSYCSNPNWIYYCLG